MPKKRQDAEKHIGPTMAGKIWSVSCKVRGIGELIGHQCGEPSLQQEEANVGIGELLVGLADDLDEIREELETQ